MGNKTQKFLSTKVREIYNHLDTLYPKPLIFLEAKDPFQFLISVILSAQTTDKQVNITVQHLFAQYPTPEELAHASLLSVEELVKPTGYYHAKAKHIIGTALMLEQDFNGKVPDSIEALTKLPGVGRKTANVIIGAIYNKPAIIVDTHFKRVVWRLGLTEEKDQYRIECDIKKIADAEIQYRFSMIIN